MKAKNKTPEEKMALIAKVLEYKKTMDTNEAVKKVGIKLADYYTWKSRFSKPAKIVTYSGKTEKAPRKNTLKSLKELQVTLITGTFDQIANLLKEIRA